MSSLFLECNVTHNGADGFYVVIIVDTVYHRCVSNVGHIGTVKTDM